MIIKLGLSALMVTHDQNEAMAISDRILLLNNGKIEQQGTPQEMYGSPTTLFTAEFMGSNNRLPGKIVALEGDRARIEGKDWALWGKAGEGVQVGREGSAVIRVERVRLGEDPQGNQLELPLLTSMYLGDRWEYLFRTVAEDFVVRAYGHEARDRALCRLSCRPIICGYSRKPSQDARRRERSVYRSSTSRLPLAREQQINRVCCAARSSSLRY